MALNRVARRPAPGAGRASTTCEDADTASLRLAGVRGEAVARARARVRARGRDDRASTAPWRCCAAAVQRAGGRGAAARRARPRRRRALRAALPSSRPAAAAAGARARRRRAARRVHETEAASMVVGARPASRASSSAGSPAAGRRPGARGSDRAARRRRDPARGAPRSPGSRSRCGSGRRPAATAGLLAGASAAIAPPLLARALYEGHPAGAPRAVASRAARARRSPGGARSAICCAASRRPTPWVVDTLRRAGRAALDRGAAARRGRGCCAARPARASRDRGELLIALAEAERAARRRRRDRASWRRRSSAARRSAATTSALARALLTHGRADEALALRDADPAELHAGARLLPGAGGAAVRACRLSGRRSGSPARCVACRAAEASCAAVAARDRGRARAAGARGRRARPRVARLLLSPAPRSTWSDELALAREHLDRALAHARRLGSVRGLARAEAGLAHGRAARGRARDAAVVHATTALGAGRGTSLAVPGARGARARAARARPARRRRSRAATRARRSCATPAAGCGSRAATRRGALDDLLAVGRDLTRDAIEGPALIPWRSAAALALPPDAEALAAEEHALAVALRRAAGDRPRAARARRGRRRRRAHGTLPGRRRRARRAARRGSSTPTRSATSARACGANAPAATRASRCAQALDLAVRCGAAALARRAREELAASGARPRRLAQSGRDALTPAELRVAHLAAARPREPRDRPHARRDRQDRRDRARPRLRQARHPLAPRAGGRAPDRGLELRAPGGALDRRGTYSGTAHHAASAGRGAPPLARSSTPLLKPSAYVVYCVIMPDAGARALGVVVARERLGQHPRLIVALLVGGEVAAEAPRKRRVRRVPSAARRPRCTTPPARRRAGVPPIRAPSSSRRRSTTCVLLALDVGVVVERPDPAVAGREARAVELRRAATRRTGRRTRVYGVRVRDRRAARDVVDVAVRERRRQQQRPAGGAGDRVHRGHHLGHRGA